MGLKEGEDRVVLDFEGVYDLLHFYLPRSVHHEVIDAQLYRNNDTLFVKMPVIP